MAVEIHRNMDYEVVENISHHITEKIGEMVHSFATEVSIDRSPNSIEIEAYYPNAPTGDALKTISENHNIVETGVRYNDENEPQWYISIVVSTIGDNIESQFDEIHETISIITNDDVWSESFDDSMRVNVGIGISGSELNEIQRLYNIKTTQISEEKDGCYMLVISTDQ